VAKEAKPDLFDKSGALSLRSCSFHAPHLQPEGDIFHHGHPGKKAVILKHQRGGRVFHPGGAAKADLSEVGCISPAMILRKVVLPHPLGPTMQINSFRCTRQFTFSKRREALFRVE
jgi:hypothetical protein